MDSREHRASNVKGRKHLVRGANLAGGGGGVEAAGPSNYISFLSSYLLKTEEKQNYRNNAHLLICPELVLGPAEAEQRLLRDRVPGRGSRGLRFY